MHGWVDFAMERVAPRAARSGRRHRARRVERAETEHGIVGCHGVRLIIAINEPGQCPWGNCDRRERIVLHHYFQDRRISRPTRRGHSSRLRRTRTTPREQHRDRSGQQPGAEPATFHIGDYGRHPQSVHTSNILHKRRAATGAGHRGENSVAAACGATPEHPARRRELAIPIDHGDVRMDRGRRYTSTGRDAIDSNCERLVDWRVARLGSASPGSW